MKKYTPPYTITSKILKFLQDIAREVGILQGRKLADIPLNLRKGNNIKTIQASLAIEGNTLNIDQITHLLNGKRILAPAQDIVEVKNALQVYDSLLDFNPLDVDDLLRAHKILMQSLLTDNGNWRNTAVGILKGTEISHIAPPAKKVPKLMVDLFEYIKTADTPWMLKACIFHYELEFIHPFQDGNGRMGRLWQQLLLMKEDPIFGYIPVEVLIKARQKEYYSVLGESDAAGESTAFIEFSLQLILESLVDFSKTASRVLADSSSRLSFSKSPLQNLWFNRKDYMNVQQDISTSTASRDLAYGVDVGVLQSKGDNNQVYYKFVK